MATEHAHRHQQLAGDSARQPFSGEKSFGRWRHLVGGLGGRRAREACIDQEPAGDDGPTSTHAMVPRPATLPGKLVAFKICNR